MDLVVGGAVARGRLVRDAHRGRGDIHRIELAGERLDDRAVSVERTRLAVALRLRGEEHLAHRALREIEPARAHIVRRRHGRDRDLLPRERLDVADEPVLARLGERDGDAFATRAARPSDPVDIGLGRTRHIEVDDMRDMLDVDAARGDIGRDEEVDLGGAHLLHHAVALRLGESAVEREHAVAAPDEALGELVDLDPRPAEDDRERRTLEVEDASERGDLVGARHDVRGLPDLRRLALGGHRARDEDALGLLQVPFGDARDPRRQRRREERGLALGGRRLEDEFEILGETHVEHLVGLVEDDRLDRREVDRAAAHVVEDATGRRDDDLRTALEPRDLPVELGTAVDRHDRHAEPASVAVERLRHLHREFARRNEDERARLERPRGLPRVTLEERQRERRGLSGARRRLSEEVAPLEEGRRRLALDRRRFLVAERGEFGQDLGTEPERGEGVFHRDRVAVPPYDGRSAQVRFPPCTTQRSSRGSIRSSGD